MKRFIRHQLPFWPCEAGKFSMVIRLDGTFAPCFELYGDREDWGSLHEGPKFDRARLARQKEKCVPHCLSTCNYQVNHYTQSPRRLFQWVAKHAYSQFLGVS
jgi:radical SAM protein with 4Fe4S-binding SPASM domain